MTSPAPAAILGLGIIGSRALGCLRKAGWPVACWNRTPKHLPGEVSTPADAIRGAKWISLYLKDVPAILEVVEGLRDALQPGQVILNHSTIDLETTKWLAAFCSELGIGFIDAPFTGSKVAAENAKLVYYLGGDADLISEAETFLRLTAHDLFPCGEVGAATVVKLATNLISACTVQALAEAQAIASHHGVAVDLFNDAVSRNACASTLSGMKLPSMAAGQFDTHFSLGNMWKDSRYVLALAKTLDTPAISAVSTRMGELCDQGFADLDYSALAKAYQ